MADFNKSGFRNLNLSGNECEDDSLPECLIPSEPLQDPYESDMSMEHQQCEKKFVQYKTIHCSTVKIWEMQYFLNAHYSSEAALGEVGSTPSILDLLVNSLHFISPLGVPEFFKIYSNKKQDVEWQSVAEGLVVNFLEVDQNKWVHDHFIVDYSSYSETQYEKGNKYEEEMEKQQFQDNALKDIGKRDDPFSCHGQYPYSRGMELMLRIDTLFKNEVFDVEKEASIAEYDYNEQARRHEAVKGVLYEIISFAGVPIKRNGECRVDFDCKNIKGRGGEPVCFKVKADGILWHFTYSLCNMEPFCAIEVCRPCKKKLLDDINQRASESYCQHQEVKYLESTFRNLCPGEHQCQQEIEEFCANFNEHTNIQDKVRAIGPKILTTSDAAQTFYAKLAMDMYGILVQKNSNLKAYLAKNSYVQLPKDLKLGCVGLFVMNQYVILTKMSHSLKALNSGKIGNGPDFICANNWWFNLQKPNDRIALIIFLKFMKEYKMSLNENLVKHSVKTTCDRPQLAGIVTGFSEKSKRPDTLW